MLGCPAAAFEVPQDTCLGLEQGIWMDLKVGARHPVLPGAGDGPPTKESF